MNGTCYALLVPHPKCGHETVAVFDEPPTAEIVQAFKAVETAKQGKDTAINNAKKYQNEQIPAAEANADKTVQQAEELGKTVVEAFPESEMAREYRRLAEDLLAECGADHA